MDPGLASAILTFVQVAVLVTVRLYEYQQLRGSLPQALQEISEQLPVLQDSIQSLTRYDNAKIPKTIRERLAGLVGSALRLLQDLQTIVNGIIPSHSDDSFRRLQKGLRSTVKDRDILRKWDRLQQLRGTLGFFIQNFPIDSYYIRGSQEPLFDVPALHVHNFVPRLILKTEIAKIFNSASKTSNRTSIMVLLGMGGEGKTQLALEYCREVAASKRYLAAFWVDASSRQAAIRDYEGIASKIIAGYIPTSNTDLTLKKVRETISSWNEPWLIVFDNFDDPDAFGGVSDLFPVSSLGSILVTSRHTTSRSLGKTIVLQGMRQEEALKLLLGQTSIEQTEENLTLATRVLERLGNLPLAIDTAGAYINMQQIDLETFLKHLDSKLKRKEVLDHQSSTSPYHRRSSINMQSMPLSLSAMLDLSFHSLGTSPLAYQKLVAFFTQCTFLNPADVHEILFLRLPPSVETGIPWLDIFKSQDLWDSDKYQTLVVKAAQVSLIREVAVRDACSRFSMHPLVATHLRDLASFETQQIYAETALHIVEAYLQGFNAQARPLSEKLIALGLVDSCVTLCLPFIRQKEDIRLWQSISECAKFYEVRCRFVDAEKLFRMAMGAFERLLAPTNPLLLDAFFNMARVQEERGHLTEAKGFYERALQGLQHGDDKVAILRMTRNLGFSLIVSGEFSRSESLLKLLVSSADDQGGESFETRMAAAHDLGFLYEAHGRLKDAEEMFDKAYKGFESTKGPYYLQTLRSLIGKGLIQCYQGELEQAERSCKQAREAMDHAEGEDHFLTAYCYNNLGFCYYNQGRLDEAALLYSSALLAKERILGLQHTATNYTVNQYALVFGAQGDLESAEDYHQRALSGYTSSVGETHVSTLAVCNDLASFYLNNERDEDAKKLLERALLGYEEALGPGSIPAQSCKVNLGIIHAHRNETNEAAALFQDVLGVYRSSLGPKQHFWTLNVESNLAILNCENETYKSVIDRLVAIYEQKRVMLGSKHPSVLESMHNVGCIQALADQVDEAQGTLNACLNQMMDFLSPRHFSIELTRQALQFFDSDPGQLRKAFIYLGTPTIHPF